jgi:cytochrome c biogenesis protein CcdA/thiol-disulfide isomerase/thioredoxin
MLLIALSYVAGVLTILSPCILPVLPFVFARSDQPFVKSGLPLLAGMAVTFTGIALLATVGGAWAVQANQWGRWAAIVLLALFGIALLLPELADRLTRPIVKLGGRLTETAQSGSAGSPVFSSALLGVATGLLWAPCAGPILGLILTGAALRGANASTALLLLAYAAGAATSLALALLIGGRLFVAMKRSLGAGEWIRRGLGVLVLCGAAAIALGLDTGVLARLSGPQTASTEQALLDRFGAHPVASPAAESAGYAAAGASLPVEGTLPSLSGAVQWLNSPPLDKEALRGKVVLIDFWTYSCINCLRALPYVEAWADKYRNSGLVVIGVHAPEFAFEKNIDNVRRAVADLGIHYPVAIDNDFAIWRGFNNEYWPAHYFIDGEGRIRHHHYGEGEYPQSEAVIRQLLTEAGYKLPADGVVKSQASGVESAASATAGVSPETYVGYKRARNFASPGGERKDQLYSYSAPTRLTASEWGLAGEWQVADEKAVLAKAGGRIVYQFHARDLHLVLGPGKDGKPVRFKVSIDGKPPGDSHGTDTDNEGRGTITSQRLYQLVRQPGEVRDRTFEIEFLDPGAEVYAFTFG